MNKLEIRQADNGYVLIYPDHDHEDPDATGTYVIPCDGIEKDTMTELLQFIAEHFSTHETMYNKFGEDNLRISWDKEGHKVDS